MKRIGIPLLLSLLLAASCGGGSGGTPSFVGRETASGPGLDVPGAGLHPPDTGTAGGRQDTVDDVGAPAGCEPDSRLCASPTMEKICTPDGSTYFQLPCSAGQACEVDGCAPVICTAGREVCHEGRRKLCSEHGTRETFETCPGGARCIEGRCRPILSNVIVLFDTSGSMDACLDAPNRAAECCGDRCPAPWPVCETADQPLSRLGASKTVFQRLFGGDATDLVRFALLTFPQRLSYSIQPTCDGGPWVGQTTMTGDRDEHVAPDDPDEWFRDNSGQVVRVPFARTWADSEQSHANLLAWVDFVEDRLSNPELRAHGWTPLGRSMFYAGEYVRQFVVVDGRGCGNDGDCGSQDYVCVDGACRDPIAHCRETVLVVFTDGEETEHESMQDFFNPVVQARRFRYGLGCESDAGCVGGATCVDGVCDHPDIDWPDETGTCERSGAPCRTDGTWSCAEDQTCVPLETRVSDPLGADVLRAPDGSPIRITTHVVNVSGFPGTSLLVAQHGGGQNYDVDVTDRELLFEVLKQVVDIKLGVACPPEPPE